MPFATTWMDLEIIILSKASQIACYHLCVESNKNVIQMKKKKKAVSRCVCVCVCVCVCGEKARVNKRETP